MPSSCSSSSSNSRPVSKAKRSGGLQGLRPQPLSLPRPTAASSASARRPYKKPRVRDDGGRQDDRGGPPGPVIIYERTPKAVHVGPDDFMAFVQRLTGQQVAIALPPQIDTTAPAAVTSPPEETTTAATTPESQHLVLTLRKQEATTPPLLDVFPAVLHSPGLASDGFLLSPGIFLFSPATMDAIHELIAS